MDKVPLNVGCPVCGSPDVTCGVGSRTIDVPFVGSRTITIHVDRCLKCGESGDFFNLNDALIEAELHSADRSFINQTVQWMVDQKISFPYLERVLSLPFGSINRWLRGDFPKDVITILRFVRTYPWLLHLAEENFNADVAQALLLTVDSMADSDEEKQSPVQDGRFILQTADKVSRSREKKVGTHWKSVDVEYPEIRRPILMKGDSGYVAPHDVFYVAGFYDPEFCPQSPWLDTQHDCIRERGWKPVCWIYIDELEFKIREIT